ncbi:MAG: hypothetical protein A2252_08800 [Elusimicrobia bacterium RIFOXYA2_FULL_39_19]|nr:MAG: hypothetical protein A2252_08800 [Elusimicrobia bacterium RIFOXYA2_FULL_39_19]
MNKLKVKLHIITALLLLITQGLHASSVRLVDTPTANIIDYYAMAIDFRLYNNGGVISQLNFGVFRKLNIGCSWDIDRLIGTQDPQPRMPTLSIKFRIYDGSKNMPAIAFGYDGQGYNYDESSSTYQSKEKGVYFVTDTELLAQNLFMHLGMNMNFSKENNKDKTNVLGFIGFDYTLMDDETKIATLIMEYDNLFKYIEDAKLNGAIRIYPTNDLTIDFAFRDIASPRKLNTERFAQINYQTKF